MHDCEREMSWLAEALSATQASVELAQCEDAVLRFLQRRALLMEGGADMSDPQTIVTFALLGAIVVGAAYRLAVTGLPPPPA